MDTMKAIAIYVRFRFLQLKVGYYLTDMTEGGQGNLWLIPGSHTADVRPETTKTYAILMNTPVHLRCGAPTRECDPIPQRCLAFGWHLHETGGSARDALLRL